MPWTEITRAQYRRSGLRYASDITDAEWALIARRMPARRHLGRPREVDLRKVVQAVLFIPSSGVSGGGGAGKFSRALAGGGLFLFGCEPQVGYKDLKSGPVRASQ